MIEIKKPKNCLDESALPHFRPLVLWLQFCVVVCSVLVAMSTVLYDCDCTYAFTDIFTNGNSSTRL